MWEVLHGETRLRKSGGEGREVVLGPCVLHVREQLSTLAHEVKASSRQVARRPHSGRIHVGLRQEANAQEVRDLVRVELVVLGFTAMNRLHRQRVAQHEPDPLHGTEVCQPVPREHAFGRHDQIVSVRREGHEHGHWSGRHVLMEDHLTGGVQDTEIHLSSRADRFRSNGGGSCRMSSGSPPAQKCALSLRSAYSRE